MSRDAIIAAVLWMSAVSVGCGKSPKVVGVNCDDFVTTPGGRRPIACVHEIPNGGAISMTFDGTSVVTLDGKVVATYPPCPCGGGGPVDPDLGAAQPTSSQTTDADAPDAGVDGATCEQLQREFAAAVGVARQCDPNATGECQVKVHKILWCDNFCGIVVNADLAIAAVQAKWDTSGCGTLFNTCVAGYSQSTLGLCVAQPDGGGLCDPQR
jgi:hypothetical protein